MTRLIGGLSDSTLSKYDKEWQTWASEAHACARNTSSISSGFSGTIASSSRQGQSRRVLTDLTSVGTMFDGSDAKVCYLTDSEIQEQTY